MSDRKSLEAALQELERRETVGKYTDDFSSFASEQIRIITKDANKGFVPFNFNTAQKHVDDTLDKQLKEKGKVRAIILKARQQGFSTYCTNRVLWKSYYTPHSRSVVMAHDSATSDALFQMSKNAIKYMEPGLRPKEVKSNAKEIIIQSPHFAKDEYGEKPVSSYRLYTAGSPEAGRGTTPTIAHLSEVAFWMYDEKILAGLFQGISEADGTEVILESTANGAQGEFYRLWKDAVAGRNDYVAIFVPWFWTSEYQRPVWPEFSLTPDEEEYLEKVKDTTGTMLTLEQMHWRRLKVAEGGELKFRQEYPAYAEEAFVASGDNVFDVDKLNKLIPESPVSIREFDPGTGFFDDKRGGSLQIFETASHSKSYIIGADVALGVGGDYSAAVVMDSDRKVVALYRNNQVSPGDYGHALFYLGRYFNNALLAVESNSIGIGALQRLDDMNYVNLYKQTLIANINKEEGMRLGFRTTSSTKAPIIANLKSAISNDELNIPSVDIIEELKGYIHVGNNKTEASSGSHDDTVMALAIALEVYRTHSHRLGTDSVPWGQKSKEYYGTPDEKWI